MIGTIDVFGFVALGFKECITAQTVQIEIREFSEMHSG
jgi:hypothetical protein